MRSINLNRVSGRILAVLVLMFSLAIGNAWAGNSHSTHYGKAVLSNATGNGTVYLSTSGTSNEGSPTQSNAGSLNGTSTKTWNCGGDSGKDLPTYYARGTANNGYYYAGYATSNTATSYTTTNNFQWKPSKATSTSSGSPTTSTIHGFFKEITITSPSNVTINATDNATTCNDYTGTLTFTTKGDSWDDFSATSPTNTQSGHGSFTFTKGTASNGSVVVNYKFIGDGTYGGNVAKASRSRSSSATVTLTSLPGNNSASCTVNASFPNIIVSAGEGADMYTTNSEPKSASATFPVQWADDADDFTAAFSGATGGGAWTVDAITYTATDAQSGVVTVDYTFDNERNADAAGTVNHSAVLTLSANTNAGGASNMVTLNAESKKAASGDAVVVSGSDETEYETLAGAIEAANSLNTNPTVRLLRNVDLGTLTSALEIKKPMTLDLASFEISATVNSSVNKLFYLNSATAVLTINDSKNGGAITVTGSHTDFLYAVMVDKGALNITKGDITISNANTGATAKVAAVCVGSNGHFGMSGGNLTSTTAGSYAYGLVTTTVPSATESAVGITGGTITATAAKTMGIGIYCQSTSATASGDPTTPNVVLSGVTVNASTEGTTDAYAIQVDAGVSLLVNSGTYTATSNTQNAYALNTKGYVAVLNGTFNANATTLLARGIHLEGGITAVRNGSFTATATTEQAHAAYVMSGAKLLNYGDTFTGRLTGATSGAWATGTIVVSGGSLESQGGTFSGNISKSGLSAVQTNYAAGIYANTGSTVSLASATLRGQTADAYVNGAYGLYTTTANALGLTNCTLYGTSAHQYAYGIYNAGTPVTMNNTTLEVNSTKEYSYGIYTNAAAASVEAKNSTVNSTAATTYAYGAYVNNGTLNAFGTTFDVTVSQTAAGESKLRGLYVNTGKSASLTDCKVTATGSASYSNNGYGLYVDGSMNIENTEVAVSGINSGAYAIVNSGNTGLINVASGKFKATATSTGVAVNGTAAAAKQKLYGGYYTTNTNLEKYLPEGYMVEKLTAGTEFGQGYNYQVRPAVDLPDPVCKIGSVNYGTLEEALEFVNKNSGTSYTIVMVKDYTLPAGTYTLPSEATLLVPYKSGSGKGATEAIGKSPDRVSTYTQPECYRRLILADGVNLIVNGTIEASAQMACTGQGNGKNGYTTGGYGLLQMLEGSNIVLNNGAKLMAWGFVAGERVSSTSYKRGSIEAKRGAKIYQGFQIADWKGGSAVMFGGLLSNAKNAKAFPINQYFVMNVEVPVLYRPGAEQYGATGVDVSGIQGVNEVPIVGLPKPNDLTHQALFLLEDTDVSEDTWIMEDYDPLTDRWIITMNSSAKIGSLNVNVSGYEINSKDYILPITHCMKLHMLSGDLTITQSTVLLPGVELEIDKEAELIVNSGQTLYLVDQDSWGKIAGHAGDAYYQVPWYSPAWKTQGTGGAIPTGITQSNGPRYIAAVGSRPALPDALLNLHGKITVKGSFHTSDGGANIFSSNEDAGTVHFVAAATGNSNLYFFWKLTGSSISTKTVFTNSSDWTKSTVTTSAQLKNGDETYEPTAGTIAGKTWIYINDHWQCWEADGCLTRDASNNPYAHPADYVRLSSDEPDANHVYKAYGSDRYFIWDADCQWWEIDPSLIADGEYKAIKADHNGKYNYYEYSATAGCWIIKKVTITWKNETTTLGTYSNVGYKTHPKYLDATPAKSPTSSEFYTWLGWTKGSETGEFFAKEAELPVATENTTYYAYFETTKFQYTITLKNYDEAVLDAKRWNAGETPIYAYTPLKPSTTAKKYTFDGWATSKTGAKAYEIDGLPAASAAATYYAHYAESNRNYTITWANYDGTVLKEEQVAYNTTPSAPVTPTRPNDDYYTYTFEAWSPAIAAVTGDQTYTATYTYEKKVPKYEVLFKNGATTVFSQNLVENTVPVFDGTEPTKAATAQYTYTFDGWSTTNGGALAYAPNAALPALTADVTYYAHFATTTNTYSVYWRSEDGKTLLHTDNNVAYGATPSYTGATPTKPRVGTTQYALDGWSATIGGAKISSFPTISGDATYYAHFAAAYEVTFDMQDHGSAVAAQTISNGGKVSQPSAPTDLAYNFGGWYKEAACTNAWNFGSDVVTAATTLYAKWTIKTFTITWKNGDTTLETDEDVPYGTTPTYNGAPPTKDQTEEWVYTHNGWTPTIESVTDDAIYTATFSQAKRQYAITWKNKDDNTLKTDQVAYGETPSYGSIPTYGPTISEEFEFRAWTPDVVDVTGAATYTADYTASPRLYPVVWKNYDGNPLKETTRKYGWNDVPTADAYDGETPVRPSSNGKTYTFSGWSDPVSKVTDGDVTYTAQYSCAAIATTDQDILVTGNDIVASVTVGGENSKLTIGDNENHTEITTTVTVISNGGELVVNTGSTISETTEEEESIMIVEAGGQLTVEENASVEADVFELIATHETTTQANEYAQTTISTYSSGQVDGTGGVGDNANTKMKAYFKLSHNGGFKARQWYAVAVPWQIAVPTYAEGGVCAYQNGAFKPIKLGRDYDLVRYDGNIRSERGNVQDCWVYVEDDIDVDYKEAFMYPGVFYMIYLAHEADTIRFERASGTAFRYNASAIELTVQNDNSESATGNDNWNGIANPTMHYAYVNANATFGQQYVVDEDGHGSYDQIDLTNNALIVGMPVFVQTISESVVVNKDRDVAFSAPSGAPRRVSGNEVWNTQKIEVQLVPTGLSYSDRIFIQTEQGKADRYTIGADVAKAGVSAYKAQMWVDRYDYQLCYNTVAPVNNSASYPLGISIPKAGEYAISVPADCLEGDMVYLTYDGRLIWNLSYAPYSVSLEKGTNTHYGIKLVRSNAPAVTTGIDSVDELQYPAVQKIIMENQVYILRNNNVYSVDGQLVK